MVRWQLKRLLAQCELETGQRPTYREISGSTGVSTNVITRIATDDAQRIDKDVVDRLLKFFEKKLGRELTVDSLLAYEP